MYYFHDQVRDMARSFETQNISETLDTSTHPRVPRPLSGDLKTSTASTKKGGFHIEMRYISYFTVI